MTELGGAKPILKDRKGLFRRAGLCPGNILVDHLSNHRLELVIDGQIVFKIRPKDQLAFFKTNQPAQQADAFPVELVRVNRVSPILSGQLRVSQKPQPRIGKVSYSPA